MPSRSSEDDEVRSRSSKDDEVPTPSSKDDEVPKLSYEVPSRSSKHYEVPSAAAAAPGAVLPACGPSNPPSLCFVCGRLTRGPRAKLAGIIIIIIRIDSKLRLP